MRRAIVWPLTTTSEIEPYLVANYLVSDDDLFPENLRQELQGHIIETLRALPDTFSKDIIRQANKFTSYNPKTRYEDDTKLVVEMFTELTDTMATYHDNIESCAPWRVRIFTAPA